MNAPLLFSGMQSNIPSQSASPSPTPELLGPAEAFKRFIEGVSAKEASWIIVALILVAGLYWISIQQLSGTGATYRTVLKWIAGLFGWAFLLYIFGWRRIEEGGVLSAGLAACSASLAFFAVYILRKRDADWQQIVSGTIIIIIGFTIASTIAVGAQALSYGIFFGCTFGMIVGMLIISIQRFNRGQGPSSTTGEWSDARPKNL